MEQQDKAAQRAELERQLAEAKLGFDPDYGYSDDFSYYSRHQRTAGLIRDLEKRLAALESE